MSLSGSASDLRRARGLALAVLTLDADRLLDKVRVAGEEGDYASSQRLAALVVAGVETVPTTGDAAECRLTLDLKVQLELRRALREGEDAAISRIATPGRRARPASPSSPT